MTFSYVIFERFLVSHLMNPEHCVHNIKHHGRLEGALFKKKWLQNKLGYTMLNGRIELKLKMTQQRTSMMTIDNIPPHIIYI